MLTICAAQAVDGRLAVLGRSLTEDDLEPSTRASYERAKTMSGLDVIAALEQLERTGREIARLFEDYDLLLTPTLPIRVPDLGWLDTTRPETMARGAPLVAFTGVFNLTGQPAMSVPAGTDADGVPVGVQFAARLGEEPMLLRLAASLEAAAPWPTDPVVPTA